MTEVDPFIGHNMDNYTFRKRIGRGTSGVVYLAKDNNTGADVAIKIINKRGAWERITRSYSIKSIGST